MRRLHLSRIKKNIYKQNKYSLTKIRIPQIIQKKTYKISQNRLKNNIIDAFKGKNFEFVLNASNVKKIFITSTGWNPEAYG
jgi:hypothetical protein